MIDRASVLAVLSSQADDLRGRFAVRRLSIFGSVARAEAHDDSDVDLLVEFDHPVGLLTFAALKQHLEGVFRCTVDLVEPAAVHPALRQRIMAEAVDAF
jgi:predicted nucleotidyltransferase